MDGPDLIILSDKAHVLKKDFSRGFLKEISPSTSIGGMVNRVSIDKTGTKGKMGFLFE